MNISNFNKYHRNSLLISSFFFFIIKHLPFIKKLILSSITLKNSKKMLLLCFWITFLLTNQKCKFLNKQIKNTYLQNTNILGFVYCFNNNNIYSFLHKFIYVAIPCLENITDILTLKTATQCFISFVDCTPFIELDQVHLRLNDFILLAKPQKINLQFVFSTFYIKYNEALIRSNFLPISMY